MVLYIEPRHVPSNHRRRSHIDYPSEPLKTRKKKSSKVKKPLSFGTKAMRCTTFSLLLFASVNGFLTYSDYRHSLYWSSNAVKMADLPVDALADTGAQEKKKEHFIYLYNKMLHSDGSLHANHQDIVTLKKALDKIKTTKPLYRKKYNRVLTKYTIRQKLNNIFSAKDTLPKDMTPIRVYNILLDISPELNTFYEQNHNDVFVKQQIRRVHLLVHDVNLINSTIKELNGMLLNKKGTLIPIASLTPNRYNKVYNRFKKLHFVWKCLDRYAKLQDPLGNVLEEQQNKINAYNDWQNDLHARNKAYETLNKKRAQHKQAFYEAKAKKRREKEEAIEQKRREEEQARIEQEKQKREEEHQKNQENNSNSSSTDMQSSGNTSSSSTKQNSSNTNTQTSRPSQSASNNTQNNNSNASNQQKTNRPKKRPSKNDDSDVDTNDSEAVNDNNSND